MKKWFIAVGYLPVISRRKMIQNLSCCSTIGIIAHLIDFDELVFHNQLKFLIRIDVVTLVTSSRLFVINMQSFNCSSGLMHWWKKRFVKRNNFQKQTTGISLPASQTLPSLSTGVLGCHFSELNFSILYISIFICFSFGWSIFLGTSVDLWEKSTYELSPGRLL